MNVLRMSAGTTIIFLLGSCATLITTGCSRSLPNGAVGNIGRYNYSPSVIQTGNVRQFWWCSQGVNPSDSSQNTDAIYFESIDMSTHESYGPVLSSGRNPRCVGFGFHLQSEGDWRRLREPSWRWADLQLCNVLRGHGA